MKSYEFARVIALAVAVASAAGSHPTVAHPGLDEQIRALEIQIAESPRDAVLRLRRAELHRLHGDWEAAERDYRGAEEIDAALHVVHFCRGKMRLEAGDPRAALLALDRFLAVEPGHADALALRGRARSEAGDPLGAAADFDRVLASLGADDLPRPDLYLDRARALVAAGPEQWTRALRGLEEGLVRLGQPVTLELAALDLETRSGRTDAALRRVDRLLERANRKESWYVRKGEILEAAGRGAEARSAYRAALGAIETLPPARRGTAHVLDLRDRAEAAAARLAPAESAPPGPHDAPRG